MTLNDLIFNLENYLLRYPDIRHKEVLVELETKPHKKGSVTVRHDTSSNSVRLVMKEPSTSLYTPDTCWTETGSASGGGR